MKFKLQNKVERLISTAFSAKILMLEFAPNGCRKSYMIQCLKHLISCGFQAFLFNQVSRIQVNSYMWDLKSRRATAFTLKAQKVSSKRNPD